MGLCMLNRRERVLAMSAGCGSVRRLILTLAALACSASAQHPPVLLYDKDFKLINPLKGENANAPFSTQNTCGTCHDYATITSGYHFSDGLGQDLRRLRQSPWQALGIDAGHDGGLVPFHASPVRQEK